MVRKGLTVVPGGHLSVILVVIIGFQQWGVREGQYMAQNGPRVYTYMKFFWLRSPVEPPIWPKDILGHILTFPDPPLPKTNNNHQYNTQVTARYHCYTFPTI